MPRTLMLLTDKPEPFRLDRLSRVVNHILRGDQPSALVQILALHDHKGLLSINWRARPLPSDIAAVTAAWAGESEYITNHFVRSRPLKGDVAEFGWPGKYDNLCRKVDVGQLFF